MAHWCLRSVDYDNLDIFAKPVPKVPKPEPRSRPSSVSSGSSLSSRGSKGKGAIKFVLPKAKAIGDVAIIGPTPVEIEALAEGRLREAMVNRESQRNIPLIIGEWPCTTLRLSKSLSPEACERVFPSLDQLWSHLLHGFLIRKPICRLRCLDLRDFIPSKSMLYTVLQLIPLLSYRGEITKRDIYDRVVITHGLTDPGILQNLTQFLDNVLNHPVFSRGKRLNLPGPLKIIVDYLPLSADKLSLYCWMMSSSLYDVTNVFIKINSTVYRYAETGSEFTRIDPLLPLEIFASSTSTQDICGLAVIGVPSKFVHKIVTDILPKVSETAFKLQRIVLSNSNADLTSPTPNGGLISLVKKFPGITRLDLSRSRVSGVLSDILHNMTLPLEFLNLSNCCMEVSDLAAIFDSKHSTTLRDLNLSYIYSSKCVDCLPLTASRFDKDLNDNACSWAAIDQNEHDLSSQRNDTSLEFWKSQPSISSPRAECGQSHEEDRRLLQTVFLKMKNLSRLTILDIISDRFGQFRIDGDSLELLGDSLLCLKCIRQINIEQLPFWDEDIFAIIGKISGVPSIQSVTLTRSPEAPTLQIPDRFSFWQRIHEAKNGKVVKISIGNFVEDRYYDKSDDDSVESEGHSVHQ